MPDPTDQEYQAAVRAEGIRNLIEIYVSKMADALELDDDQVIMMREGLAGLFLPTFTPGPPMPPPSIRPRLFYYEPAGVLYDWLEFVQHVATVSKDVTGRVVGKTRAGEVAFILTGEPAADFWGWLMECRASIGTQFPPAMMG